MGKQMTILPWFSRRFPGFCHGFWANKRQITGAEEAEDPAGLRDNVERILEVGIWNTIGLWMSIFDDCWYTLLLMIFDCFCMFLLFLIVCWCRNVHLFWWSQRMILERQSASPLICGEGLALHTWNQCKDKLLQGLSRSRCASFTFWWNDVCISMFFCSLGLFVLWPVLRLLFFVCTSSNYWRMREKDRDDDLRCSCATFSPTFSFILVSYVII